MVASAAPRIALIHALSASIAPVAIAFRELWPEAERINLLDDSLSVDRARAGALTPTITARIAALADYARRCEVRAILFSCSAFGMAIEAVARSSAVPVLKPNEAMFTEALAAGRRIGMLATFEQSVAGMEDEFRVAAGASGVTMTTVCVPAAMAALQRGDPATHDALLADAARSPELRGCDVLMLAQFSMARARDAVHAATRIPVLTAPHSAVALLRARLGATAA